MYYVKRLLCSNDVIVYDMNILQGVCPEHIASFPSYLVYDWFTPTVVLGYKENLEKADMWHLGPRDRSKNHVPGFEADWTAAVAEWRRRYDVY